MAKQCGECRHLDTCHIVDGQGYCSEKNERRFANDLCAEECDDFDRVGWGYTSDAKEAIAKADEYVKEHTQVFKPSGCFITTITVNILGMGDKCNELMVLRNFRETILQRDSKYRDLLVRYDSIGPALAKALAVDEDKLQVAMDLYNIYIKGCVRYIECGNFENAIVLYTEMVERLINRYMITPEFIPETVKEKYLQDGGGHGVITLRTV